MRTLALHITSDEPKLYLNHIPMEVEMHEAFWNGLFDVRWENAPLGQEAIRLVRRLGKEGYAERTWRDYGHAVIHLGRVLYEEAGGVPEVRDDAVVEV